MGMGRQARVALGITIERLTVWDWIWESSISIVRHPGRSLVTALGTALGTAAFVATLGLGSTLGRQVSDSFDARRATEVVVRPDEPNLDTAWQGRKGLDRLRGLNGVTAAGRRVLLPEHGIARAVAAPAHRFRVIGADPGALAAMIPELVSGRRYDDFHERHAANVVLLPQPVAEASGINRTGVAVFIGDRPYTVAGIFRDVARRPEALLAVVMPATTAERLEDPALPAERDVIIATAPGAAPVIGGQAPLALWPEEPGALHSVAPADPRTMRREIEANVTRISLVLSLVALVMGAISIANAATASIVARIPEIGLRRAIGARPVHIFAQLVGETTALGALGGLAGVGVGVTVVSTASLANGWPPVLDLRIATLAVGASAAAGLLAGLWPAARATRIQPVAALQR